MLMQPCGRLGLNVAAGKPVALPQTDCDLHSATICRRCGEESQERLAASKSWNHSANGSSSMTHYTRNRESQSFKGVVSGFEYVVGQVSEYTWELVYGYINRTFCSSTVTCGKTSFIYFGTCRGNQSKRKFLLAQLRTVNWLEHPYRPNRRRATTVLATSLKRRSLGIQVNCSKSFEVLISIRQTGETYPT